jgi:hypothetical protein
MMGATMFTVEERDRIRDRVLAMADADQRVVAAAAIGSLAKGPGDQWSDLDLGFGIADGAPVDALIAEWTEALAREFDAVHLFDLVRGPVVYRVFLFPGYLQVDLSFAPGSQFGALGPNFTLLFGEATQRPWLEQPSAQDLFGLSVHHAVRTRFCIARGRLWQAQYWINELRDHTLALACRRRGLETAEGRGYQGLPADVLARFEETLVRSIEPAELLRALASSTNELLREADQVRELASKVDGQLRRLVEAEW